MYKIVLIFPCYSIPWSQGLQASVACVPIFQILVCFEGSEMLLIHAVPHGDLNCHKWHLNFLAFFLVVVCLVLPLTTSADPALHYIKLN